MPRAIQISTFLLPRVIEERYMPETTQDVWLGEKSNQERLCPPLQ